MFDLFERDGVALVEKAAWDLQIEADQLRGIQTEVGEKPVLGIINGNQVCQPVDALEDDPRGPGGKECRRRLRGGDSAPDEDVHGLRRVGQHLFDRGIESQGRLAADESGGLASFQDNAPDSRAIG